jgi:hypothetical protein
MEGPEPLRYPGAPLGLLGYDRGMLGAVPETTLVLNYAFLVAGADDIVFRVAT